MSIKPEVLRRQGGDRASGVLSSLSPTIVSPGRRQRKVKTVDAATESIRSLVRTNQQMSATMKELIEKRKDLISKIEKLEGEIVRDQDLVATLRERVSGMPTPSGFNDSKSVNSGAYEIMSAGSAGDFKEFVKKNPLIMKGFTGTNPEFSDFVRCCQKVPRDVVMDVVGESLNQIYELSRCFDMFERLKEATEDETFLETVESCLKVLFCASDAKVLVWDRVSKEYLWKHLSLNLKEKCMLQRIIDDDEVCVVERPNEHQEFLEKVDGRVVPRGPVLFIPIEYEALIVVKSEYFGPSEVEVAKFVRILWGPLLREYNDSTRLNREVAFRRNVHSFETKLLDVNSLEQLLTQVLLFVRDTIGAEETKLFVVKSDSFRVLTLNESRKLVENNVSRGGVVSTVVESHDHVAVEHLDKETEGFELSVDEWALENSFAAVPVMSYSQGGVIAVLCLKNREGWNKFTGWDVECASSLCSILSPKLSVLLAETEETPADTRENEFETFADKICQFTCKDIAQQEAVCTLARLLQSIIHASWLSIYTKTDLELVEIITIHDGKLSENGFVETDVAKRLFEEGKDMCGKEGLQTTGGVKVESHLYAINKNLLVVAINSSIAAFEPKHVSISKAFLSYIDYALAMKYKDEQISQSKRDNMMLMNMFQVAESLLTDPNPLPKLLDITRELLSMEAYLLCRYSPMQNEYRVVLPSHDGPSLPLTDVLISEFPDVKCELYDDFGASVFSGSSIVNHLPQFKQLLVVAVGDQEGGRSNWSVLVFCGQSIVSNYDVLLNFYMKPLIRIYLDNYDLSQAIDFDETTDLDKVNFFNSEVKEKDLLSLNFDPAAYTDSQTIEILLEIFMNLGFIDLLGASVQDVASFFVNVRHSYSKNLPFHNWTHIVDSVQLLYFIVKSSSQFFKDTFSSVELLALFLAGVCHDVDHDGFDTEFHRRTCSPLFFAHGEKHCQERHHISVALELLQAHLIKEDSKLYRNDRFWDCFVQIVLCSDATEDESHISHFEETLGSFDNSNDDQKLAALQLVFKVSNSAACYRPFDTARLSAANLEQELKNQYEAAKSLGHEMPVVAPLPSLETQFVETRALPMLRRLIALAPSLDFLEPALASNLEKWKAQ